ncbi:T9SS type A sorting domain-containing protein [uncultured Algibacter sp.]|uniref:T9SS type A sorting domain-containing protein n=1 Tax=uncultured Algibacter sp. TaxID=298659 RepID=UPI0026107198|nr:T9SS type A sorting domain-containing protein [uncultured Algibacter sp.]
MKNFLVLLFILSVSNSISQTVAYDSEYFGWNNIDCVDLNYNIPQVIGHQNNVEVTFFLSISDAQNNVNQIPRFYSYTSDNQVLFARVTNLSDTSFAISQVTLNLSPIGFPPPGYIQYDICDIDNDVQEIVYLNNLTTISGNSPAFNNSFCGLFDNQIVTTFYTTEQDAENQTNSLNEVFQLTQNTDIYYRISNTANADVMIHYFGLTLQSCVVVDVDNDGLENYEEDSNRNGNYFDDDTDKDGLMNYEDLDDDGDGILTIQEDYNGNGDPKEDDTNFNGIADYLEANVTLGNTFVDSVVFKVYPNPVIDRLFIESNVFFNAVSIYNISGSLVKEIKINKLESNIHVSMKTILSGTYFIKINSFNGIIYKRFIKQ